MVNLWVDIRGDGEGRGSKGTRDVSVYAATLIQSSVVTISM